MAGIEIDSGSAGAPMTPLQGLARTVLLCRDLVLESLADENICNALQSVRVLCVSDLKNLSSYSGQTALATLVFLLSRMGVQVGLQIPEVDMVGPQPPLATGPLRAALLGLSGKLISGAHVQHEQGFEPDLVFALGDTKFELPHLFWRLQGEDWAGSLKSSRGRPDSHAWRSSWTVGAMVSAALAANEAFKYAMRTLPLRDQRSQVFLESSHKSGFSFGHVALPEKPIDLGNVDVISGGAISQSALYALLRFPGVQMSGRIFDDDITAESNLNRNMLSLSSDIGGAKVRIIAGTCVDRFQLQAVKVRLSSENVRDVNLASRVVIGVDDIPSRWEVQRNCSGWLAVGGTSHFSISSSSHKSSEPCCGCLHPVDDPAGGDSIPTISFVSFWAGLATAVRLLRECTGQSYSCEQQHLWMTPLRLDQPYAAMWMPVAAVPNCPVRCSASTHWET